MSAARAAAVAAAALISSSALCRENVYADGTFRFPYFGSSAPSPSPSPPGDQVSEKESSPEEKPEEKPKPRNDNPRTTAAGFDPEALERGAKALREINSSSQSKKVYILVMDYEIVVHMALKFSVRSGF